MSSTAYDNNIKETFKLFQCEANITRDSINMSISLNMVEILWLIADKNAKITVDSYYLLYKAAQEAPTSDLHQS